MPTQTPGQAPGYASDQMPVQTQEAMQAQMQDAMPMKMPMSAATPTPMRIPLQTAGLAAVLAPVTSPAAETQPEPRGEKKASRGHRKDAKKAEKAKKADTKRKKSSSSFKTAKQMIPYESMAESGACYLGDDRWSITMSISDVNYQISPEEHQMQILDGWAKWLNNFGEGSTVQIGIMTRILDSSAITEQIAMRTRDDGYDDLRQAENQIQHDKLSGLASNTRTDKFVTIAITEPDPERAMLTLNRIALDATSQLHGLDGCVARRMDRVQRLDLLAKYLRPGEESGFDERSFAASKLATKDYCCPWAIDTKDKRMLTLVSGQRETYHRTLWIREYPPELTDQLVSELSGIKANINVAIHLKPYDRGDGLELVKRTVAELDMQVMSQRRKNIKQNMPEDQMPHDLADAKEQADELLDSLQRSNERLLDSIVVIGVSDDDKALLDQHVKDVTAACRRLSCVPESLDYMQIEGLQAELPLGVQPLPMSRTLTTNSAAILIPFTTQEVFEPSGVFYGTNAQSGNPLVVDRRLRMNQNGFILGTTGSGKSASAKSEMTNIFLGSDDDIVIIDPEHEYGALCERFGGQAIRIAADSDQHINPMDVELGSDEGDPLRQKTSALIAMLSALLGGSDGLDPIEKSLMDRVALDLYRARVNAPQFVTPTLVDLANALDATGEPEGHRLALALGQYTEGSSAGFAGRTNVSLDNRFVVFDVNGLEGEMKTFGMMVVLDQVWNRVIRNRSLKRRTWLYADEFHRFFSNPYASKTFLDIFKRARKWGLGVTGITQNIEELLINDDARLMLANADFLLLMNQNSTDADSLCDLLRLSAEQRAFFTGVQSGQGLLKSGAAYIPLDGRIRTDNPLYKLYSTKFGE